MIDINNKKVIMSGALAHTLHLNLNNCELELEHWYELCHPEDNDNLIKFKNLIFKNDEHAGFMQCEPVTLDRRLYCGDGVYRRFILDALILRSGMTGAPLYVIGVEHVSTRYARVEHVSTRYARDGKTSFFNALGNDLINLIEIGPDDLKLKELENCIAILYLIPVRAVVNYDDMRLLNALKRSVGNPLCGININIIILLTQIDVERDLTEAGMVIKPRDVILRENIALLEDELKLPVVPVSIKPERADNNINNNINENVSASVMTRLLMSMREERLRERFASMQLINHRALLLSADSRDNLKLISRLAHNVNLFKELASPLPPLIGEVATKSPEGLGEAWLYSGRNSPPSLFNNKFFKLKDKIKYKILQEIVSGIEILAAPSDMNIINMRAGINWNILFAQWTPIIHVDLNRLSSSLVDLERAPYFKTLKRVSRFVIAYSNAGFFDGRLDDLSTIIPEHIKKFMKKHKIKAHIDWFIYENYNADYTDLVAPL